MKYFLSIWCIALSLSVVAVSGAVKSNDDFSNDFSNDFETIGSHGKNLKLKFKVY